MAALASFRWGSKRKPAPFVRLRSPPKPPSTAAERMAVRSFPPTAALRRPYAHPFPYNRNAILMAAGVLRLRKETRAVGRGE
jgi:hypothetical protein